MTEIQQKHFALSVLIVIVAVYILHKYTKAVLFNQMVLQTALYIHEAEAAQTIKQEIEAQAEEKGTCYVKAIASYAQQYVKEHDRSEPIWLTEVTEERS